MADHLIEFSQMEWEHPRPGVSQKIHLRDGERLRLLRFHSGFVEDEWCTAGHVGHVLNGEMTINFNGRKVKYKKGDGLWITAGEDAKHKVTIGSGKQVELILFERIS